MTKVREKVLSPEDRAAEAAAHFGTAVIEELSGDFSTALEHYCQAARADLASEQLTLEVSGRLLLRKETEKALDLVSLSAARPEASAAIHARLALIYSQLGKMDQAVAANRTAIRKAPTSAAAYVNLFTLFVQAKRNEDAVALLDEAARQPKGDAEFYCAMADLYLAFERQNPKTKDKTHPRIRALLDHAAALKATSPLVLLMLADGYGLLEDSPHAAQFYLEALARLPDSSPLFDVQDLRDRIHTKLAAIYLHDKDHKHAAEQVEARLAHDPTNPSLHYFLAEMALEDKKYEQAANEFRQTIILSPGFERAYYDLATALLDLNKPVEALTALDQARERFAKEGSNFVLEFITGMAFGMQKAWNEALSHFAAAEVIARNTDPTRLNEFFYFELGAAYERKGDLVEAEKYFQKCLQIAPAFAQALNYLGYMWAEHDLNLDKAREMIAKAVKAEPENSAYLDSMGWVLFKLNQPREALEYLLHACRVLEKPDATVLDHLGDIYQALKQSDKAREAWEKALAVEPSDDLRKKLAVSAAASSK